MLRPTAALLGVLAGAWGEAGAQTSFRVQPATGAPAYGPGHPGQQRPPRDARGNPLAYALTGHVSNYDEAKVGAYTLPDPLVLESGEPVRDADTWFNRRRPEIVELYEREIYGRVPPAAPSVRFEVVSVQERALEGAAILKHVVGRWAGRRGAGEMNLVMVLPSRATVPVPVLLHLVAHGGLAAPRLTHPSHPTPGNTPRFHETGQVADLVARGYGYATLRYAEIEGDQADASLTGVRRAALSDEQSEPAADEWGTIAAWAWGASRALDYFETDAAVDAKRAGLLGHALMGKAALWAMARDPRFAIVWSSCSGEMGAALARRDYGECVDDLALEAPWQFAGNFQKYLGRWHSLPVDAHLLIALCAPRPVFVTAGSADQWSDPHGQFLAQVAAEPVYRLLGRSGLGTNRMPMLDTPLVRGDLGFLYHAGGAAMLALDWKAFLQFADRHLHPER